MQPHVAIQHLRRCVNSAPNKETRLGPHSPAINELRFLVGIMLALWIVPPPGTG